MIVPLLTQYYDAAFKLGIISDNGWEKIKVSYAMCLDLEGNVVRLISTYKKLRLEIRSRLSLRL